MTVRRSYSLRVSGVICLIIAVLAFSAGCSIPNLEDPECTDARNAVREFYSYHFGNDMTPSPENLKLREKYLSRELYATLSAAPAGDTDYFTGTSDLPKAFRVGTCKVVSPDKTLLQVLLFWRTDVRNEQRAINVEAVRENEGWRVNKVTE